VAPKIISKAKVEMNQSDRFDALTGIRCVAACMIFLYHNRKYWRDLLGHNITSFVNELHIGVSIFFVLSGFLIAYTYRDLPIKSFKDYLYYSIKRIARIFPLYWLLLTAYYFDDNFGKYDFSWLTYSLFHGFSERHNLDGISQAWSLTVEVSYYAIAPILYFITRKNIWYALLFLLALFLLTLCVGFYWKELNNNPDSYFYPISFLLNGTLAGQSFLFFSGLLLAKFIKEKNYFKQIPYKTWLGVSGILLVIFILICLQQNIYDQGNNHFFGIFLQIFILPIFISFLLWGLIVERNYLQILLSSRLMVLLGNASFSFYLIHISYFNLKLKNYIFFPDRNFVLLWGISILLYTFIEKPIYLFIRKRIES
jgi:peptidoglycan/LPS O-acetylase OafA/YrhL